MFDGHVELTPQNLTSFFEIMTSNNTNAASSCPSTSSPQTPAKMPTATQPSSNKMSIPHKSSRNYTNGYYTPEGTKTTSTQSGMQYTHPTRSGVSGTLPNSHLYGNTDNEQLYHQLTVLLCAHCLLCSDVKHCALTDARGIGTSRSL